MTRNLSEFWDDNVKKRRLVTEDDPLPTNSTVINNSVITVAVKNLNFAVTTAGVEAVGTGGPLANRHTIIIINDSSTMISVSLGVNDTFGNSAKLFSGQAVQISFSPDLYIPVYVRTPYFNTTVGIIEVAGGY